MPCQALLGAEGSTPRFSHNVQREMISMLLGARADLNVEDNSGKDVFELASALGSEELFVQMDHLIDEEIEGDETSSSVCAGVDATEEPQLRLPGAAHYFESSLLRAMKKKHENNAGLHAGTAVVLEGLVAKPELNGEWPNSSCHAA